VTGHEIHIEAKAIRDEVFAIEAAKFALLTPGWKLKDITAAALAPMTAREAALRARFDAHPFEVQALLQKELGSLVRMRGEAPRLYAKNWGRCPLAVR
jgi:hypothetical protein